MEVQLYLEKQRIQECIQARAQSLAQHSSEANERKRKAQTPKADPVKISLLAEEEHSDDSEATMVYPEAIPIDVAEQVASTVQSAAKRSKSRAPKDPVVPMTIQNLWKSIEDLPLGALDPPSCKSKDCPYCTQAKHVPLMLQRYNLMQRLVQLEKLLYGI